MASYEKNLTRQIHLRLDSQTFDFCVARSDRLGLTVSEYIRRVLDAERRAVESVPDLRAQINDMLSMLDGV